jgi:DNA polymerase-3 subunit delta'
VSDAGTWNKGLLPWQQEPWSRLCHSLDGGGLPHALLLVGAEHIGKLQLARAFAALLLCEAPVDHLACGQCRTCNLLQAGSHADFKEIAPLEDSRLIRVDQIRQLIDFANKTAGLGQRKVILLHPAEAMNVNASNALLKCLEEPAANTHLLLVSHRPSALAATIRSRCQTFTLGAPEQEGVLGWLDQMSTGREQSKSLLQAAQGRPQVAMGLLDETQFKARQTLQLGLDSLANGTISALEFPQLVADLDLDDVLASIVYFLETRVREGSLSGRHAGRDSFALLDDLGRLHRSVLRGANPNRQLALEDAAGRLAQVL